MKHYIDPKVDCVFKAIFGALERSHLLVHFINAVVRFDTPIVSVSIENPYIERQHINAKLSIVDIKAKDSLGRIYQVEMQMTSPAHLISRMSQNLSQLHGQQLKKGDHFAKAQETIAIWLLTEDIGLHKYPAVAKTDHKFHFEMYEVEKQIHLPEATHLHVIQMNRWCKPKKSTMQHLDYWIYFFMKANGWKHLPEDATIPEISEAMTVLEEFSNDPEKFEYYQSRHRIQLAELSVEAEHKQIRVDYANAVKQLDSAVEARDKESQLKKQAFEERDKLVKNLLANKTMTIEQIAEVTGMSIADINDLKL